jgi:aryl-alcohol dehydrogenase-like predicted oxidoreductase
MKVRRLCGAGLQVSAIGLGCMGMSQSYGQRDDEVSALTLQRAIELGVTLFDTADLYGGGHNEQLIGRVLRPYRQKIVMATKVGLKWSDCGELQVNGHPEYLRTQCEASLKRLGVDAIDLYYLHRVDPKVPIEESVGALSDLVRAGHVRYIGLSECSADDLRRAHWVHRIAAVQSEYSLWTREVEAEVLPTCRELGIAFVPFSPLGRGFLSGAIRQTAQLAPDDMRANFPRFQKANLAANLRLVDALIARARLKSCSPAQLALAWVLAQGDDVIPIPGTKSPVRLAENISAEALSLSGTEVAELSALFIPGAAAGARYPEVFAVNQL